MQHEGLAKGETVPRRATEDRQFAKRGLEGRNQQFLLLRKPVGEDQREAAPAGGAAEPRRETADIRGDRVHGQGVQRRDEVRGAAEMFAREGKQQKRVGFVPEWGDRARCGTAKARYAPGALLERARDHVEVEPLGAEGKDETGLGHVDRPQRLGHRRPSLGRMRDRDADIPRQIGFGVHISDSETRGHRPRPRCRRWPAACFRRASPPGCGCSRRAAAEAR